MPSFLQHEQGSVDIAAAIRQAQISDPGFHEKPLSQLNSEATACYKAEDYVGAVAAYHKLFDRQRLFNLHHPELFICRSNRAAAYNKVSPVYCLSW